MSRDYLEEQLERAKKTLNDVQEIFKMAREKGAGLGEKFDMPSYVSHQEREVERHEKAIQERKEFQKKGDHAVALGDFTVSSECLYAADPCYSRDEECSVAIKNVRNGRWTGAVVLHLDNDGWGIRNAELHAYHVEHLDSVPDWKEVGTFSVESGQGGVYCDSVLLDTETIEHDDWYEEMCANTLNGPGQSVVDGGLVSMAGYGDGGYGAEVSEENGSVVAVRLVYINLEHPEFLEDSGPDYRPVTKQSVLDVVRAYQEEVRNDPGKVKTQLYRSRIMSLEEQIEEKLKWFGSLYGPDDEWARHRVMNSMFIVLGSGHDWSSHGTIRDTFCRSHGKREGIVPWEELRSWKPVPSPNELDSMIKSAPVNTYPLSDYRLLWKSVPDRIQDDYLLGIMEHIDALLSFGVRSFRAYGSEEGTVESTVKSILRQRGIAEKTRTKLLDRFKDRLKDLGYSCSPTVKYEGDVDADLRLSEYFRLREERKAKREKERSAARTKKS